MYNFSKLANVGHGINCSPSSLACVKWKKLMNYLNDAKSETEFLSILYFSMKNGDNRVYSRDKRQCPSLNWNRIYCSVSQSDMKSKLGDRFLNLFHGVPILQIC